MLFSRSTRGSIPFTAWFLGKKHSTKHALIDVLNQIQCNFKKVIFTCGIFIDLEKAFETVDHNILLEELQYVIME